MTRILVWLVILAVTAMGCLTAAQAGLHEKRLFLALESSNSAALADALAAGANPNAHDRAGMTPLFVAAASGDLDSVKALIKSGAKPDPIFKPNGATPLIVAAHRGYLTIVEFLLHSGSKIDARTLKGSTALHQASTEGFLDIVRLLIDRRLPVDVLDKQGQTPLIRAVSCDYQAVAEFLLDRGADLNLKDSSGFNALFHAAVHGHTEMVDVLLAKGAVRYSTLPAKAEMWPLKPDIKGKIVLADARTEQMQAEVKAELKELAQRDPGLGLDPSYFEAAPRLRMAPPVRKPPVVFRLVEEIAAFDSIQTHKELWLILVMTYGKNDAYFRNKYAIALKEGRVRSVLPGTIVTVTGKATGMATEVFLPYDSEKWWMPNDALKTANIPVPKPDIEYYQQQMKE